MATKEELAEEEREIGVVDWDQRGDAWPLTWYAVAHEEGFPRREVWSLSPDPNVPGWRSDSVAMEGYGLPKAIAERIAATLNACPNRATFICHTCGKEVEFFGAGPGTYAGIPCRSCQATYTIEVPAT